MIGIWYSRITLRKEFKVLTTLLVDGIQKERFRWWLWCLAQLNFSQSTATVAAVWILPIQASGRAERLKTGSMDGEFPPWSLFQPIKRMIWDCISVFQHLGIVYFCVSYTLSCKIDRIANRKYQHSTGLPLEVTSTLIRDKLDRPGLLRVHISCSASRSCKRQSKILVILIVYERLFLEQSPESDVNPLDWFRGLSY